MRWWGGGPTSRRSLSCGGGEVGQGREEVGPHPDRALQLATLMLRGNVAFGVGWNVDVAIERCVAAAAAGRGVGVNAMLLGWRAESG